MKTGSKSKAALRRVLREWKKREREYFGFSLDKEAAEIDSNRYEGIQTGTRWCIEDLEEILK